MPLANPQVSIQIGSFVNANPARTALPAAHFDQAVLHVKSASGWGIERSGSP